MKENISVAFVNLLPKMKEFVNDVDLGFHGHGQLIQSYYRDDIYWICEI